MALKQYLERDVDARMRRTRFRPLVTGQIGDRFALGLGLGLVASGVLCLITYGDLTTATPAFLTSSVYIFVYTPGKKVRAMVYQRRSGFWCDAGCARMVRRRRTTGCACWNSVLRFFIFVIPAFLLHRYSLSED